MTRFVALGSNFKKGVNEKYVQQTYDAMSKTDINLELIAIQISQLPVREQHKFLRLLINYIEQTANQSLKHYPPVGLNSAIELCTRLIDVVNDYYFEQDENQLQLEGI